MKEINLVSDDGELIFSYSEKYENYIIAEGYQIIVNEIGEDNTEK